MFIDEAYQLNPEIGGSYMRETVDEIVKCLTSVELKGRVVVVLAGYEHEIDQMLRVNAGLPSRFTRRIMFSDLTTPQMQSLFLSKLPYQIRNMITSHADLMDALPAVCESFRISHGFSNGRDIETWAKQTSQSVLSKSPAFIDVSCLETCMKSIISKRAPSQSASALAFPRPNLMQASCDSSQPPPSVANMATAVVAAPATANVARSAHDSVLSASLFENVPDNVLETLQNVLVSLNLNNQSGIADLLAQGIDGPLARDLITRIAALQGITPDTARALITTWLDAQQQLQEQVKELEKRKLRPIWRCGVCGRADKPYIVCYVAPYVVRYEES